MACRAMKHLQKKNLEFAEKLSKNLELVGKCAKNLYKFTFKKFLNLLESLLNILKSDVLQFVS